MKKRKDAWLYCAIKWLVRLVYPKMEIRGLENLPNEPAVIVSNHAQMNGPIACELYFPGKRYTRCAGQMMHLETVSAYAFQDFWSGKPRWSRWFYKLLSYIIAPVSVCVFNNADTIPVYHDARIVSTFKNTVKALNQGANVVIFPEHDVPHNHILCQFQDKFIDVAKLYYKRTGNALQFVPMYIAPMRKQMYLGEPVVFVPENGIEEERRRISEVLMARITSIACSLPEHIVVPYPNIPRKKYPSNKEKTYERTGG